MRLDLNLLDHWCRRRWLLRASLAILFVAIAFYFGPNRILFGKWTWIAPVDFVPTVRDRCEPVVRAMKRYARDHGYLPTSNPDIGLQTSWGPGEYTGIVRHDGTYEFHGKYNQVITYEFTPGHEVWRVRGAFTRGVIPYPPVQLEPATRP